MSSGDALVGLILGDTSCLQHCIIISGYTFDLLPERYFYKTQLYPCLDLQTEYKRIQSPLKYQTRCVATFPDKQGFLVRLGKFKTSKKMLYLVYDGY